MISGNRKYRDKNMPVAATFIGPLGMKVNLEHAESKVGSDNTVMRDTTTGLWAEFEKGHLFVENKTVLKMLLEHDGFNRGVHGFFIDPTDPTGFWRANGLIEEDVIYTYKKVDESGDGRIDPKKLKYPTGETVENRPLAHITKVA